MRLSLITSNYYSEQTNQSLKITKVKRKIVLCDNYLIMVEVSVLLMLSMVFLSNHKLSICYLSTIGITN